MLTIAALALLEALGSWFSGIRWRRSVLRAAAVPLPAAFPPATLILPCRGIDPGLAENLSAYFQLEYPDFQLLVVTDHDTDPCAEVVKRVAVGFPAVRFRLLIAGPARGRSQKVHNLLFALSRIRTEDGVVAFGDSDIRPHRGWLKDLAAGLDDPGVGLSSGFRWYVPRRANPASRLRAAWNAGAVTLMSERDSLFGWGGAMATRSQYLSRCSVAEVWSGALSDDYAISRAVHSCALRIRFQPRCISFSYEDCSLAEMLEWTGRQLAITRVYHPKLFAVSLVSQCLNSGAVWGGLFWTIWSTAGNGVAALLGPVPLMVLATYALGVWKAALRLGTLRDLYPAQYQEISRHRFSLLLLGPVSSLVTLVGLVRALFTRKITWRGIRYELVSPTETRILNS